MHSIWITDHEFPLNQTGYSKINNLGIENPGILNDPRIKKENIFFEHYCSRINNKKIFEKKQRWP